MTLVLLFSPYINIPFFLFATIAIFFLIYALHKNFLYDLVIIPVCYCFYIILR